MSPHLTQFPVGGIDYKPNAEQTATSLRDDLETMFPMARQIRAGDTGSTGPGLVALVSKLEVIFHDVGLYKQLLQSQGSDAQSLLNTFQWLLDRPEIELHTGFRRSLIVATQRLSKKSHLYPVCYELRDVVQESQDPVAAGGFADIYKGTFEGQAVCMKVVRIYRNTNIEHFLKQFSKEAILWGQLLHPNVLPIYGLYRFRNSICLVSPWMERGDINQYLQTNPEASRVRLAVDVAEGLAYLHKNGIIHGDLKGPNILVNDAGVACLADFGISSVSDADILAWTSHSSAASKGGSARWQAPELFDMEGDQVVKNSVASDVYAWSCVCYEIFTNSVPFANIIRDTAIILQVKAGARPTRPEEPNPSWRQWGLTENIWSLMQDCWEEIPTDRPTIDTVIELLAPELGRQIPEDGKAVFSPSSFRRKISGAFNAMLLSALDRLFSPDIDMESVTQEDRASQLNEAEISSQVSSTDLNIPASSASTSFSGSQEIQPSSGGRHTKQIFDHKHGSAPGLGGMIRRGSAASDAVLQASLHRRKSVANYYCPTCGQMFKSRRNLNNHVDGHVGIQRHTCEFCDKQFATRSVLQRHQRSAKCLGSQSNPTPPVVETL